MGNTCHYHNIRVVILTIHRDSHRQNNNNEEFLFFFRLSIGLFLSEFFFFFSDPNLWKTLRDVTNLSHWCTIITYTIMFQLYPASQYIIVGYLL